MVICIQMCLRDTQVARLIGICLHSLDERDIFLESLGCPLQLCCIHVKCSSMLTRIFGVIIMFDVRFNNNNNAHCVLVFGCVAMCRGWSWQAWGFHSSFAVHIKNLAPRKLRSMTQGFPFPCSTTAFL